MRFAPSVIAGELHSSPTFTPDGKEYILRLVGPGETFAEAAVFSDAPYPATAITLEDCRTLYFPKAPFLRRLAESPALARNMLATLSRLASIIFAAASPNCFDASAG